ncbi:DUF6230 family protein [Actinoplanes sp. CA-030573]|uniref:DUF6230 family protein n=1 Tax=Actinoplanes sp. CA-030573 TaxID=3239898 RepID=UPI003D90887A
MKDSQGDVVEGRTNWRRFAIAMGIPTVAAGVLVAGVASGAVAASFSVSGTQFKLSADKLVGEGFTQYSGRLDTETVQKQTGQKYLIAAKSGIRSADITNLCQTVAVGPVVLRIEAGKNTPVHADNLLIGMSELSGDAEFTNINIGQDASTMGKADPVERGDVGGFGQQADKVTITNLHQVAYSTQASTFKLTGMSLKLFVGDGKECF